MEILLALGGLAVSIVITRLLGAWMLRINEVISLQKDILNELRRLRVGEDYKPTIDRNAKVGLFQKSDPNRKPL